MNTTTTTPPTKLTGKALTKATKPYASEDVSRSWWNVISTLFAISISTAVAAVSPWWQLRLAGAIATGLIFVRLFVLYHDYAHGAILRKSKLSKMIFYPFGFLTLAPLTIWRRSHNYHHAHNMKVETSGHGSFPMYTTKWWKNAGLVSRLAYRFARHPFTIAVGYVTVFTYEMCIEAFVRSPKKNWQGGVAVLVHGSVVASVWYFFGFTMVAFTVMLPFAISAALGSYLFYAQHNFEGVYIQPTREWNHARASLESSSFIKFGPVMNWLTANIGYHHIHHLNPMIPFYRLPEIMSEIPELQEPVVTTLRPWDIIKCLRLKLWDPETNRMVSFREAKRQHKLAA